MIESPSGYTPYQKSNFPPKSIIYLAHATAAILSIIAIFVYRPDPPIAFFTAAIFGISTNLFLHESIHYVTQSWLGYDPVFELPNRVWTPNEAFSTNDGVLSLMTPQLLTLIYIPLLFLTEIAVIDFMVVIALIFNITGGFRDLSWAVRRLLWPKGHLVLVDSEGEEFVTFPNERTGSE